jgi:hypothetical protein
VVAGDEQVASLKLFFGHGWLISNRSDNAGIVGLQRFRASGYSRGYNLFFLGVLRAVGTLGIWHPDVVWFGGADRDRTDYLLNAIQALSQMSYSPISTSTPGSEVFRQLI